MKIIQFCTAIIFVGFMFNGFALGQSPATPAVPKAGAGQPGAGQPGAGQVGPNKAGSAQAEAGEPRASTSAAPSSPPLAAPAAAAPAAQNGKSKGSKGGKNAADRVDLDTTTVTGNRELPKVMYVVPWKRSDIGDLIGRPANSLLDEVLAPVDRNVFRREVQYYQALKPDSATSAPQGEK